MIYTVSKLAELTGLTPRTLRYYDTVGLLSPKRNEENGYRLYDEQDVATLGEIVVYRSLDMPLHTIRTLLGASDAERETALKAHLARLVERQKQTEVQIQRTRDALRQMREEKRMCAEDTFESIKKQAVEENEAAYGAELRQRYGQETMAAHKERYMQMTREEWEEASDLEKQIMQALREAVATGDTQSEQAKQMVRLHAQWLAYYWPQGTVTPESHAGIAAMYPQDERFAAYYEQAALDGAKFLADAVRDYYKD